MTKGQEIAKQHTYLGPQLPESHLAAMIDCAIAEAVEKARKEREEHYTREIMEQHDRDNKRLREETDRCRRLIEEAVQEERQACAKIAEADEWCNSLQAHQCAWKILARGKKEPFWCEHMTRLNGTDRVWCCTFTNESVYSTPDNGFKFCPICAKPKPEEINAH